MMLGATVVQCQANERCLDAVRQFAAGEPAIGTHGATPLAALRAFEGVIPKADDWRTLGRVAGARAGETV